MTRRSLGIRWNRAASLFVILALLMSLVPFIQPAPAEAQDTATYTLYKYECPPGYDPGSGDANLVFSTCTTPIAGVGYSVQSGDGSYNQGGQTNGSGMAQWTGIPLGVGYGIAEQVPSGYGDPWVYCEVTGDPNNPGDVQQSYFRAPGGVMDVGYTAGYLANYTQATCYWFNIPPAQGGQQGNQGQQYNGGTATVYIQKYYCDPTRSYNGATYADYQTYCQNRHGGVQFTINNGTPSSTGNNTGSVEFAGLPPGQADIRLIEPPGYAPLAVYCVDRLAGQNTPGLDDTSRVDVTHETTTDTHRISHNLQDGYVYYCVWYDIPLVYDEVYVFKYNCPPGFDTQGGGFEYWLNGCTTPASSVGFSLISQSFSQNQSTDSNGMATFTDVPVGEYGLYEEFPAGYAIGRVYCGYSDQPATPPTTWDPYDYPDGAVVRVETGKYLYCVFFDLPIEGDYGAVKLYKFNCPPGIDWQTGTIQYLASECIEPGSNVYFELNSASYTAGATTDSTGMATWTDIPLGLHMLTETPPQGYAVGRVFCRTYAQGSDGSQAIWVEQAAAAGYGVSIEYGGQLYDCVVFDVPHEGDYGGIQIYKYYCEPGFDWTSGGFEYLLGQCTSPQDGVYFEAQNGSYTSGQTTDSSGAAAWSDAPPGTVRIVEQTPSGYQVGRIWCGVSEQNSGTMPTSWTEYTYSGGYDVEVQAGWYLTCYVFDVPYEDYGTIYIYKYYCDPGFDWQGGGYDYLLSGCTSPHADISFEVQNGGYTQGQTTDGSGFASWTSVPSGTVRISEQPPAGYQVGRVFCGVTAQNNLTQPTSWTEYTYAGGYEAELPTGQYLHCYVFDVPYEDYGTVYVYKYYCPPGFDWPSGGLEYLLSGCTTPHENVYFELQNNEFTQGQTTDSSGTATWTDVPSGTKTLVEQAPDGYQVGRVYCGVTAQNLGTLPSSWEEYTYNGSASVEVVAGQYLHCYVFDVPTTYGTVYLYKYYCPPEFDWQGGGYDYLLSGCTSPHSDVYFELQSGGYTGGQTTDSSGTATWTDVPAGQYDLYEEVPSGYKVGRIYCGYSAQSGTPPSTWEEYDYQGTARVEVEADQYLYCYVFDVPYEYGWITLYKYYCPPEFDWQGGGYDYLVSGCASPHEGIYFEVESGSYFEGQTTDSSGMASWSQVPPGTARIYEQVPDGYRVGRIYCGYSDSQGSPPSSWTEYTYTDWWDVPLGEGEYLTCYVFDVPYEYGTVYLYKYYCPPDFDWQGGGYDYLYSGCTSPHANVYFEIGSGSYQQGQTTDSSGYAEWTNVPAGPLTIVEYVPDGYQVGRVYCGVVSQNSGTLPTSWDEYPYDQAFYPSLPEGQYLHCYIFDVPREYGYVTIWKYGCPDDFDPSGASLSYYESECTQRPSGIEFELWNQPYGYQETMTTDSGGEASWSDVPSGGSLRIYELPNGYVPIAVYCGTSSDGSPPSSWDEYGLDSDGSVSGLTVQSGWYVYCKWYNKPYDNPQVWFYKYNCQEGANWHWSYHQLLSSCTTPGPNVEFGYGKQGDPPMLSVLDDQGKWLYDSLSPGVWYWEESYPSGYSGAVVYCQWVDPYGSGSYQKAQLDGAKLWLDLDYGEIVKCYWFDFPTGYAPPTSTPTSGGSGSSGTSGGTGGPPPLTSNVPPRAPVVFPAGGPSGPGAGSQANQNAPATLIIVKFTCPEGYDLYAEDADVEADCAEETQGIDFALTDLSTPNASPVDQTTGQDGKATWSNLRAGPYLIQESLPDGTHAAFIWTCESTGRQFQLEYPFTPFSYAGPAGEIGITLIGGETLECHWYDVPVAPASVTIVKFECPGAPVIVAQCTPAGGGVQFQLTPAEGVGPIVQLTTDETGSATGGGAPGAYTLAEQGGTPCLIDSQAIDGQGRILLTGGETAEVKVYNCGGSGS